MYVLKRVCLRLSYDFTLILIKFEPSHCYINLNSINIDGVGTNS